MEEDKKIQYAQLGIGILVFLTMFIIYYQVHPLFPYDNDDWAGISRMRYAFPEWRGFNPIKVLPETSSSLVGYFGAYAIAPLIGDYIKGVRFTASLLFSTWIAIYITFFYQLLHRKLLLKDYQAFFLTIIFFMFHFIAFKSMNHDNVNLFSAADLTCVFHYTLSAAVNCSLVLYFIINDGIKNTFECSSLFKKSMLITWCYFAIFSNVFDNIILAIYVGIILLCAGWLHRNSFNLKDYLSENKYELLILFVWLIALLFEANGGRANDVGVSISNLPIKKTLTSGIAMWKKLNTTFIFLLICFSGYGLVALEYIRRKSLLDTVAKHNFKKIIGNEVHLLLSSICAIILMVVYLFLVSAKAGASYFGRIEVLFSVIFYILLALSALISIGLKILPKLAVLLPIICFIVTCTAVNPAKPFKDNVYGTVNAANGMAVSNDLIRQIQMADKQHKKEIIVHVPVGKKARHNWPHPLYMGSTLSYTLYSHGLISRPLKVEIIPDGKMNEKYGIPISQN